MSSPNRPLRSAVRLTAAVLALVTIGAAPVSAQIKAQARSAPTPPWNKGILPISAESYWNAVECGKQGGQDPPCVFFDSGLCRNEDFTLAMYTPYKMVAYEVWRVVRQKQPAPTPNYAEAQRTRVSIGITPVKGSKNPLTDLVLKRGGKVVQPVARLVTEGDARFTYDYPAFAATADLTLDLVGKSRTVSCLIDRSVLASFR
jgi:hypothetical protein